VLSAALCRRNFLPAGGEAIADIDTLRQQAARRDGVPADGVAEPR
jgi:hypothetical protein